MIPRTSLLQMRDLLLHASSPISAIQSIHISAVDSPPARQRLMLQISECTAVMARCDQAQGSVCRCCDRRSTKGNATIERVVFRLLAAGWNAAVTTHAVGNKPHERRRACDAHDSDRGSTDSAWFHVAASHSPGQARREAATSRAALDARIPLPSPPRSKPSGSFAAATRPESS